MTAMAQASRPISEPRGRHLRGTSVGSTLTHALASVAALMVVWLAWPATLGGPTGLVLVSGHSMEPTYRIGDVAITWKTEPAVGDVVLFSIPDGPAKGEPVIHRIVGGDPSGWITQGDNNANPDEWKPTNADVHGAVVFALPMGRSPLWVFGSKFGVAAVAGMAVALWMWPDRERTRGRHLG
jgi:signal peptidase